jgi:hypothetical protein
MCEIPDSRFEEVFKHLLVFGLKEAVLTLALRKCQISKRLLIRSINQFHFFGRTVLILNMFAGDTKTDRISILLFT